MANLMTMKARLITLILIVFSAGILFSSDVTCAEASVSHKDGDSALRALELNRLIRASCKDEVISLRQGLPASKSYPDTLSKLKRAHLKWRALRQDTERLWDSLSASQQAAEFLKDTISASKWRSVNVKPKVDLPERLHLKGTGANTAPLHEKALRLVEEGLYEEAVGIYEDIILKDPNDDQAYLILGHVYMLLDRFRDAEESFMNSVHIDQRNSADIIPFYDNLVLQNPRDDGAFARLGYACVIVGDLPKAVDAFRTALDLNPDNPAALAGLKNIQSQNTSGYV